MSDIHPIEFCFVDPRINKRDLDLFFGPIETHDEIHEIKEGWNMADLMVIAKVFPSKGQAKNNGWNIPIPLGFQDLRVGKRKTRITTYIYKQYPPEEFDDE